MPEHDKSILAEHRTTVAYACRGCDSHYAFYAVNGSSTFSAVSAVLAALSA